MKKPFEIVFLSGKGGTGKTTITAAFSTLINNAVIADCDVDAANMHLVLSPDIYHRESFTSGTKAEINRAKCTQCGICMDLCRFNAIECRDDDYFIDKYACEGCGLCVNTCPDGAISLQEYKNNYIYLSNCRVGTMIYGKLGIAGENSGKLVSKIRQYAKDTAVKKNAQYILIDGPPGIGCPAISSVTGSDAVVAITEPTLSGWHDLQRLIEMINRFQINIFVIVNKYDLNEDISRSIEAQLNERGIPVLGKIVYDREVILALLENKSIIEYMPDSLIASQIKETWNAFRNIVYEPKNI